MSRKPVWPPRPRFHKSSGRWRLRWRGTDHYFHHPIDSDEGKQEYAAMLVRLSEPAAPPVIRLAPSSWPTIAEGTARWLSWSDEHTSNRHDHDQYRLTLAVLLRLYGDAATDQFGPDELEMVREEMGRLGWCMETCNRRTVRIKTVWRKLERWKMTPPGAWANLRTLPKLGPRDREFRINKPRSPAEFADVLAVCRKLHYRPFRARTVLLLQWHTGARPGELLKMRPREIDASGDVWVYRPPLHKNAWRGHDRAILLSLKAQAVLRPWLVDCGPDEHVFRTGRGRCYSPGGYGDVIRKACRRAGVQMIPYACRHAAKQRVTRVHGLDAARSFLGQKSISATDHYAAQTDIELAKQTARKMG
jgi:integrase